jgi:uncharacterized protein YggE
MSKIKLVAAVGVLAAILAVPAWGAGAKGAADPATTGPQITVTGLGTVKVVPDIAGWWFSVTTRATNAKDALKTNSADMTKVIAAIKGAGIPAADIRTSQVSLNARTNQDGTAVIGYEASNGVNVKVRNQAVTGAIVDAAVQAGADGVSGPSFQNSAQDALSRDALAAAFDDAKAKAARLAQRAGLTLGKAINISEQGVSQPIFYAQGAAKSANAAADSAPVEPGQSEVQANVTVTFSVS